MRPKTPAAGYGQRPLGPEAAGDKSLRWRRVRSSTSWPAAKNGTLYVGVTTNLLRRAWEHREGLIEGFTTRYGVKRLVWYEVHGPVLEAIAREKAIKRWRRPWKIALIEAANPTWRDLYPDLA